MNDGMNETGAGPRPPHGPRIAPLSRPARLALAAGGWLCFGLGWLGIFLPGLPTTIFWILAALAFVRVNEKAYTMVISHKRFGPGVRLFVEEGKIRRRGKIISIVAMMTSASIGALAMQPLWLKLTVIGAAALGSLWVGLLPVPDEETENRKARPGQACP